MNLYHSDKPELGLSESLGIFSQGTDTTWLGIGQKGVIYNLMETS